MTYKIEAAKGMAVCVSSHIVKARGKIVFRGSFDACQHFIAEVLNALELAGA